MTLSNHALQKIRKEANYSQENMADLMKIDQGTYNRLENGKIKLRMDHILKIAKALNKSEDDILNRLKGCVFNNSVSDTTQTNQYLLVNHSEKEYLQQLLIEKERVLNSKEKLIKSQSITIFLLQAEIERLRKP
jgi:transcriptional regulator with XRE-family HTH domain